MEYEKGYAGGGLALGFLVGLMGSGLGPFGYWTVVLRIRMRKLKCDGSMLGGNLQGVWVLVRMSEVNLRV